MEEVHVKEVEPKEVKDYLRLIAAQNESTRRIRIEGIRDAITDEQRRRRGSAIVAAISFAGFAVATHFSGINPDVAIQTEIQALNSFEALKDYLSMITPAMYATMAATAASFSNFIRHNRAFRRANKEFDNMVNNEPENLQDLVEKQAKTM